jgi:hypothetical protein
MVDDPSQDPAEVFGSIFRNGRWLGQKDNHESVSGWGSTLSFTEGLRPALAEILRKLDVRTFLDAPCGDFNWMQQVPLPEGCQYIGGDIVAPLIDRVASQYTNDRRRFQVLNILQDDMPPADLWLCRDCLFHMPLDAVMHALENSLRSNIRFYLITSLRNPINHDIPFGKYRPLNLQAEPFSLPEPLLSLPDYTENSPKRYLCLWSQDQVRAAVERARARSEQSVTGEPNEASSTLTPISREARQARRAKRLARRSERQAK